MAPPESTNHPANENPSSAVTMAPTPVYEAPIPSQSPLPSPRRGASSSAHAKGYYYHQLAAEKLSHKRRSAIARSKVFREDLVCYTERDTLEEEDENDDR